LTVFALHFYLEAGLFFLFDFIMGGLIRFFNAGNGQAYFFSREDTYSRFDIKSGQLNGNYPKPVNHKTWKGASFTGLKTVIVAAVNWGNGKAYLFDNLGNYHRWDIESKKVDSGYPKSSQKYWDFREVNAAVNFGNGKAYLFSGTKVTRRDVATRKTDLGYPRKISADFPRLPFKTIDAAYNPGGGKVYFFSDKQYARYDLKSNKIDPGFPKITSSHWIGLE
jgi:YHS domain-containing protein